MEAFGIMDLDNDKSLSKDEVPVIYRLVSIVSTSEAVTILGRFLCVNQG